jgi:hypothetical protein
VPKKRQAEESRRCDVSSDIYHTKKGLGIT